MKYSSLQEYFYKFQNVLYLLVLLPLVTFTLLFIFKPAQPTHFRADESDLIVKIFVGAVAIDWVMCFFLFKVMLKSIQKQPGLGLKLERYYHATVGRYRLLAGNGLVMAAGFFISGHTVFSVLLGLNLILSFALWPRPSKVCNDLKLRGDEREMVYYKKMNL